MKRIIKWAWVLMAASQLYQIFTEAPLHPAFVRAVIALVFIHFADEARKGK